MNMFDSVFGDLWANYKPVYIASVIFLIICIALWASHEVKKTGVLYFRELVLIVSCSILSFVPMVNTAGVGVLCVAILSQLFVEGWKFLDRYEKKVIYRRKK